MNKISIEVTLEIFAGGNFQEKCSGTKKARVQKSMQKEKETKKRQILHSQKIWKGAFFSSNIRIENWRENPKTNFDNKTHTRHWYPFLHSSPPYSLVTWNIETHLSFLC